MVGRVRDDNDDADDFGVGAGVFGIWGGHGLPMEGDLSLSVHGVAALAEVPTLLLSCCCCCLCCLLSSLLLLFYRCQWSRCVVGR